jgi:hypothetical protein
MLDRGNMNALLGEVFDGFPLSGLQQVEIEQDEPPIESSTVISVTDRRWVAFLVRPGSIQPERVDIPPVIMSELCPDLDYPRINLLLDDPFPWQRVEVDLNAAAVRAARKCRIPERASLAW